MASVKTKEETSTGLKPAWEGILNWVLTAIKDVGFPIVACIFLAVLLFTFILPMNDQITKVPTALIDSLGKMEQSMSRMEKILTDNLKEIKIRFDSIDNRITVLEGNLPNTIKKTVKRDR